MYDLARARARALVRCARAAAAGLRLRLLLGAAVQAVVQCAVWCILDFARWLLHAAVACRVSTFTRYPLRQLRCFATARQVIKGIKQGIR